MRVVAGVLLEQQVAVPVDVHVVGLVEERRLRAVQQELDRAAQLGLLDVFERHVPQAAAVAADSRLGRGRVAALGGEEIEHVRVPRIPGAVLDPVERRAGHERLRVLTRARLVPVDLGEVELDRIALDDRGPELGVGRHRLVQCVEP